MVVFRDVRVVRLLLWNISTGNTLERIPLDFKETKSVFLCMQIFNGI